MATVDDLTKTLAAALGVDPALAEAHAYALRGADLWPDDDNKDAHPEHAAALLTALMTGQPPETTPRAVELFAGLPLDRVNRCVALPDGRLDGSRLPDDHPHIEQLREIGETFGVFFTSLISWFTETGETDFEVVNLVLGGGPGNAQAAVCYAALVETETILCDAKFSLAPFGGGFRPDDAPRARLDRQAVVPGKIFPVLREFFTGDTDGPRELFVLHAETGRRIGQVN